VLYVYSVSLLKRNGHPPTATDRSHYAHFTNVTRRKSAGPLRTLYNIMTELRELLVLELVNMVTRNVVVRIGYDMWNAVACL